MGYRSKIESAPVHNEAERNALSGRVGETVERLRSAKVFNISVQWFVTPIDSRAPISEGGASGVQVTAIITWDVA